jgi:hypothetical protein
MDGITCKVVISYQISSMFQGHSGTKLNTLLAKFLVCNYNTRSTVIVVWILRLRAKKCSASIEKNNFPFVKKFFSIDGLKRTLASRDRSLDCHRRQNQKYQSFYKSIRRSDLSLLQLVETTIPDRILTNIYSFLQVSLLVWVKRFCS